MIIADASGQGNRAPGWITIADRVVIDAHLHPGIRVSVVEVDALPPGAVMNHQAASSPTAAGMSRPRSTQVGIFEEVDIHSKPAVGKISLGQTLGKIGQGQRLQSVDVPSGAKNAASPLPVDVATVNCGGSIFRPRPYPLPSLSPASMGPRDRVRWDSGGRIRKWTRNHTWRRKRPPR